MAIVQISKIQQRSGNLVDLPQLDNAEFGWASDQQRLFIGRTGSNVNPENVEVLTSYSNISFSQIAGSDGGNFNITSAENGQLLTYVASTDTWENFTGTDQLSGGKLQLGDVSNISITGPAGIGYVLETDGTGNLSWTPKGTLYNQIINLTNNPTGNVITMKVANTTPYTNQQAISISNAAISNSGANSNINGQTFYVKLATDYASTGNVTLYTDATLLTTANGAGLTTYTANSGVATAVITSGGGSGAAGGATNSIQYNSSGIITGDANLIWDFSNNQFTVGGNANVSSNVNVTGNINLTRQLITTLATGTAPMVVTSTTRVSNLNVATSGVANTVNDAAQANITSVGTLTSLNSSGNITAPIIIANTSGTGNNFKVGDDAWIGDINIENTMVVKGQQDGANAYIVFGTGDTTSTLGRAGTGALTYNGAFTSNGNLIAANVNTAGNVTASRIISNVATGTAPFTVTSTTQVANLSVATAGSATTAGTVTTAAQPNITSVGTLTSLGVSGAVTASTLVSNVATGTAPFTVTSTTQVANLSVATAGSATTAGTVTTAAQPNITSVGTLTSLAVTGNVTSGNVYANSGTIGANLLTGTLTTASQPNITSLGTLTGLTLANASTITANNVTLTTGANTNAGTITGNWTLSTGSKLQATYADLAEYYEADQSYEPGTVLQFGGNKEVTIAEDGTTRVAGVVSTDPAYVMNSGCEGDAVAIALQGRVPTKVRGTIRKGDMMVSAGDGFARPAVAPIMGSVIGKALQDFDGIEGVIEVAVGRL